MPTDSESRLDAFGDLTVPVEVRIGKCTMKVAEIAALQCGSTVPLDRSAGETLELIVGNLRLAMAEVVVNEDRLAVRITEFLLPESHATAPAVRFDRDVLSRLTEVLPSSSTAEVSPAERIADLELSVHATLGRTGIPLRDVFKLMVGSMIDIGKAIADPVDVVVNDRVIARGQVVICHGSYGVKLTHQLTGSGGGSCRSN